MVEFELIQEKVDKTNYSCGYCMFGIIVKTKTPDVYECNKCHRQFKVKEEKKLPEGVTSKTPNPLG